MAMVFGDREDILSLHDDLLTLIREGRSSVLERIKEELADGLLSSKGVPAADPSEPMSDSSRPRF